MTSSKRIVLMGSDPTSLGYLAHELRDVVNVVGIIVERPVSRTTVLKRRIKRFGFLSAFGQALFAACVLPLVRLESAGRIKELESAHGLRAHMPEPELMYRVPSVNAEETIALLKKIAPDAILVYGTRLIGKKVLDTVSAPLFNIHAGITPRYRGGHGAYWALREEMPEAAGVTLHRIDAGIDTGEILAQETVPLAASDTFATYPLLQLIEGAKLAREYFSGKESGKRIDAGGEGPLYAHPTAWGYLTARIVRGVR